MFVILILLNFYGSWKLLNSKQHFLGHLHFTLKLSALKKRSFSPKKITKYVSNENPVTLALSYIGANGFEGTANYEILYIFK